MADPAPLRLPCWSTPPARLPIFVWDRIGKLHGRFDTAAEGSAWYDERAHFAANLDCAVPVPPEYAGMAAPAFGRPSCLAVYHGQWDPLRPMEEIARVSVAGPLRGSGCWIPDVRGALTFLVLVGCTLVPADVEQWEIEAAWPDGVADVNNPLA